MENTENNTEIDETALAVKIFTDFKSALPQQIAWNYEDLKAALESAIAPYRGLVLEKTGENVKFAKNNRAKINKLATAIMDARVETKKRFLEPYQDFEEKCNALIAECRSTSGELDEFVKSVEAEIKERKVKFAHDYLKERLLEVFSDDHESIESPFWVEFESSHKKWQNLTYGESDIKADIDSQIDKAKDAINTVKMLYGSSSNEILEKALIEVRKCFDTNLALKAVTEYQKEQERIKKLAEERKLREEEAKKAENERIEREKLEAEEKNKANVEKEVENSATVGVPLVQTDKVSPETPKPPEAVSEPTKVLGDDDDVYTLRFEGEKEVVRKVLELVNSLGIGCDNAELRLIAPRGVFHLFRKEIDSISGLNYKRS